MVDTNQPCHTLDVPEITVEKLVAAFTEQMLSLQLGEQIRGVRRTRRVQQLNDIVAALLPAPVYSAFDMPGVLVNNING